MATTLKPSSSSENDTAQASAAAARPDRRPAATTAVDSALTTSLLGIAVGVAATVFRFLFSVSSEYPIRALAIYAVVGAIVVILASRQLAPRPFGAANRLTMLRAALALLIAGFIFEAPSAAFAWLIIGLTILVLVLDGADGWVARRSGQVTAFGARFDMETDAALTLILATLCWRFDKVGAWILAVGLMRYLFAGFALFVHWIARPLPYSRRRQTIYVLQMSGLLAVMSPLFPVPASSLVGLATLSMLSASFAIDVAWLARHRPR